MRFCPMISDAKRFLCAGTIGLFSIFAVATDRAAAGEPVLTLITQAQGGELVELTLDDLSAMPQTTIVTETEFTDGAVAFSGPLMRDLLRRTIVAGKTQEVRFRAANDYFVDIPLRDFVEYDVILAMEADGKPLSRREKGPLWLMYPITGNVSLQDPHYIHRLIWQVVRIEAL